MPDPENNIEELENQFPAVSGMAFAAARQRVLDSGNSVMHSEEGNIYLEFPDGHRVLVKSIAPPIPNVPGRKITIR